MIFMYIVVVISVIYLGLVFFPNPNDKFPDDVTVELVAELSCMKSGRPGVNPWAVEKRLLRVKFNHVSVSHHYEHQELKNFKYKKEAQKFVKVCGKILNNSNFISIINIQQECFKRRIQIPLLVNRVAIKGVLYDKF